MGMQNGAKLEVQDCLLQISYGTLKFSSHTFAVLSTHEQAWPRIHINVTIFTRFAQNCNNIGSLVAFYGSTTHVLYPQAQLSFAVLHTCFSVCNTAKLGIGPGNKAMNLAVLYYGDFRTSFFSRLVCRFLKKIKKFGWHPELGINNTQSSACSLHYSGSSILIVVRTTMGHILKLKAKLKILFIFLHTSCTQKNYNMIFFPDPQTLDYNTLLILLLSVLVP